MILLDKLRLINWHYFLNVTADIKKITFLTGANGTGKSTIIDAMQLLLTGDTAGRNFNKAASEKTGRTLKGYLRGDTGETDSGDIICLRHGKFSSYVAMEFTENENEYFTLGIVFDCIDDSYSHQFFYIKDKFPENNFTNVDIIDNAKLRPLSGKELVQFCKQHYRESEYTFFESNLAYQKFIKDRFGGLPDKYFTLFKKAVGFTPISNIAQFITEFVCDLDYHVDITPMQSNIEQYKLLEVQAKAMQERIDKLTGIQQAFADFRGIKNDMVLSSYIVDRANYEVAKKTYEASKYRLEQAKLEIESLRQQIEETNINIKDLSDDQERYTASKLGLQGYSVASGINSKKNELLNRITALTISYENAITQIKEYVKSYDDIASKLVNKFNENYNLDFLSSNQEKALLHLLEVADEVRDTAFDIRDKIDHKNLTDNDLTNFQSLMSSFNKEGNTLYHQIENELYSKSEELDMISSDLDNMSKGQKPFSPTYLELRSSFYNSLKARHSDAFVDTFCDLIDIKDKTWTRAIEAVLYKTKFNFFVNDEYYEEANEILVGITRRMNIYSVSLVDASRLIDRNFEAKKGSLAEVIYTEDDGARAYVNYLLGNIKRCRTFEEARNSGNGLLPDCTGYHNFSTWYLNREKSKVNYIGTALSDDEIFERKEEFNKLDREYSKFTEVFNYLSELNNLDVMSLNECNGYKEVLASQKEIKALENNIEKYDEELQEGDLDEVNSIDAKIQAISQDISALQQEKEEYLTRIGEKKNEVKQIDEILLPNQLHVMEQASEKLTAYSAEFVENVGIPFFDNALANLSIDRIKEDANRNYIQKSSKLRSARENLINLRARYVNERHLNYDTTNEESNEEFDKELESLSQVELPAYKEKIVAAHDKAVKEFKDDFIYKLRTSIMTVSSQIDELNQALKDVKFGRDSYRFSVAPNRDYQEYYDMITDDLLLSIGDTEDQFLQKYSTLIENLIDLITSANTEGSSAEQKAQVLQNIDKFTDYRTYLTFDLKVKTGDSEVENSLARTFKKKSGGETQTPFYISILASFAQLYRTNKKENNNTIRLVIFDEAFSKMDAARIIESVSLLRYFNLQVILSTPTEKVPNLSTEVDVTLTVHHDDKSKSSYISAHEDLMKNRVRPRNV